MTNEEVSADVLDLPPPGPDDVPLAELAALFRHMFGMAGAIAFISILSAVVGIAGSGISLRQSLAYSPIEGPILRGTILIYLALIITSLVPAIHLLRFRKASIRFVESRDVAQIEAALKLQGRLWRFLGVVTAFALCCEAALLITAIVARFFARLLQ